MSGRLFATQLASVTMGVIGAGLIISAVDKTTSNQPKKLYINEKLRRFVREPEVIVPVRVVEPIVPLV